MRKNIVTSISLFVLVFSLLGIYFAKTTLASVTDVANKEEGATNEFGESLLIDDNLLEDNLNGEIDSFELFWPVTAGKVRGDSLYFLKRFKEKLRGVLIFSDAKKADYEAFIATKRVVEAEKLFMKGDSQNATLSLDDANEALKELNENWEDVSDKGSVLKSQKDEINNKLSNLKKFLPYLAGKYKGSEGAINRVLDKVRQVDDLV